MCQAIDEMIADAKEEGIREAQIRGEQERRLFACLVREQRYKELERATQEEGIRLKLMEEYGLFPYEINVPMGGQNERGRKRCLNMEIK